MEINIFRHAREARLLGAGEVLFHEGTAGDVMFAVVEGEVELTCHHHVIDVVGPGGIIGELALIDPAPRSATATARSAGRGALRTARGPVVGSPRGAGAGLDVRGEAAEVVVPAA